MDVTSRVTVLYAAPFWVAVYERVEDDRYMVCRIPFGAEPKDCEVYAYLLRHWNFLSFSPPIKADDGRERRVNPKRMHRDIRRQLQPKGLGTQAQQALKRQYEEGKAARKKRNRCQREEDKKRLFTLRQERKKAKHRGR